MDIQLPSCTLSGRYKIIVTDKGGSKRISNWFDNLVTDLGLDQISNVPLGTGSVPYLLTQAYVGTGDAPVAVSDVSLSEYLSSSDVVETTGTSSYVAGNPPYWRYVRTFTFAAGTVTGTLSEVGVGYTKDTLFSRALITDALGEVSPVKVLADEGIQLVYELRSYINPNDVNQLVTIDGNIPSLSEIYNVVIRPAAMTSAKTINIGVGYAHTNVALYSGDIQNNTLVPLGSSTSLTTYVTPVAYAPGSFTSNVSFSFATTSGNYAGGVKAVRISNSQCDFQIGITPPIIKMSSMRLTMTFSLKYGRSP